MSHSYAEQTTVQCPHCSASGSADIWLILDTQERPDLVKQLQEGTLHQLDCKACGKGIGQVDVPLLIYQPSSEKQPLVFSPANQALQEQTQEHVQQLLGRLHNAVQVDWQDSWLEQLVVVPRSQLVSSSQGSPSDLQAILQELEQPIRDMRAMGRRVELCQQALILLERQGDEQLWAALKLELGNSLAQNPQGDRADNIEQAIEAYKQALQVRTREAMPVEWAASNNLALAYTERIRGDRADNIEQAINIFQQALQVTTREAMPVEWAASMNNLALAYSFRIRGDRADNIEQAIKAYEQALQVRTREAMPVDWAQSMNNLAGAYRNRIRGDRADNIEQAIEAYEQALQVMTREAMPIDWATSMMNLAHAYSSRIRGDRADNIEQAIEAYEQALQVRTREAMPVEWAQTMNNLASAYSESIRGDLADNLEQAIDIFQQALQVRTRVAMPVEWAQTMNNLATAYYSRIRGDRADNLERAIEAYEQALQVRTREAMPVEWATSTHNLATAYYSRIRGDRADNLEQAIEAYQQALQVTTREAMPVEWAQTMNNLATAYYSRIRGDRADNLERAIEAYEQALQVRTREAMPVDWARSMHNLATAYRTHIRGDRADNLEWAIEAYEQALQVTTREAMPVDWAQSTNNLANAYADRIRGDRADNLERAIEAYQQALQVTTREAMPVDWAQSMNNLAIAYADRIRGNRADNIEQAIKAYRQALQVMTREAMPVDCRRTSRLLANLLADESRWQEAAPDYAQALGATEDLYNAALSKASQTSELATTNDLFRCAAYAYAQTREFPTAIATLEQGRARGLRETLERDRADLFAIETEYPDLYERYQKAAEMIRALEITERSKNPESPTFSTADLRDQAIQALTNLNSVIADIRQLPGYDTFLTLPTFDNVTAAVQPGQPLVYLVATSNGSLALILHRTATSEVAIQSVSLDFTDAQLRELLVGPLDQDTMTGWFGAYNNRQQSRTQWLQVIDSTTQALWQLIMSPLVDALTSLNLSQVTLIPSGLLSFLPLHAAWTEDTSCPSGRRYACDHIRFSYTPSATAFRTAREIAIDTPVTNILAIDDPQPVSANLLPNSHPEVTNATSTFPNQNTILSGENAIREAVLAAIPNHSVLHFSCHGYANFKSPLDSGLLLANNETLTLRDFFNTQLSNVRLAILSACETGLPGTYLPDEALGLPTGLLQAGVPGIAASLWSVADLSTMMLLSRFYDYWRQDGLPPSEALRQAQIWVRDTTNGEKITYFEQFMPDFIPQLSTDKMAGQVADFLFKSLMLENPDERTFAHPFHWAAFTYVGV